jgi:hypothetical protein
MTAFDGLREAWESPEPRPVWRIAKDALGLVLSLACAVSFVFLVFVLMVIVGAV